MKSARLAAHFSCCPYADLRISREIKHEKNRYGTPTLHGYDEQTDTAVFLICKEDSDKAGDGPAFSDLCAEEILDSRTSDEIRSLEGINRVSRWSVDELLSRQNEWDFARIIIKDTKELSVLHEAGILYDFSSEPYWNSRDNEWPREFGVIPGNIIDENGKIIAVSYSRYGATNDEISVIIINAKSTRVRESLRYAEHWMNSYEWLFDRMVYQDTPNDLLKEGKGICIYKSNVSW